MIARRWKRSKSVSCTASQSSKAVYTGRFAPSPSGPLHLGSLTTALASYLVARSADGRWLLRIDDIDGPRLQPGASAAIQASLEAHGLLWDGSTVWQSHNLSRYQEAAERLMSANLAFYCRCSRAQLNSNAPYPGTCRDQRAPLTDAAIRVRCLERTTQFADGLQGAIRSDLGQTCGDFVIWRRDGLPAYQLATAVDDGAATITHVVRGNDLLDITARQLHLMELLGLEAPRYTHVPVVVDADQVKLSKRSGAAPLDDRQPGSNLRRALGLLGVPATALPDTQSPGELLEWAITGWQLQSLRGKRLLELQ